MDKMKLQEENKDLIKEIEMYQIEIERLKSLLTDGDPIGCHVDGRSVIGDKRPRLSSAWEAFMLSLAKRDR